MSNERGEGGAPSAEQGERERDERGEQRGGAPSAKQGKGESAEQGEREQGEREQGEREQGEREQGEREQGEREQGVLRPSTRRSRCRISISRDFGEDKGTQRSSLLSCLARAEPRRQAWL